MSSVTELGKVIVLKAYFVARHIGRTVQEDEQVDLRKCARISAERGTSEGRVQQVFYLLCQMERDRQRGSVSVDDRLYLRDLLDDKDIGSALGQGLLKQYLQLVETTTEKQSSNAMGDWNSRVVSNTYDGGEYEEITGVLGQEAMLLPIICTALQTSAKLIKEHYDFLFSTTLVDITKKHTLE